MYVPRFLREFSRNKLAFGGAVVTFIIVFIAIFYPLLTPYNFAAQDFAVLQTPSAKHWFGTDQMGRDVFSRILAGSRVSMVVGLFSIGVAALFGGTIGIISGFYGGIYDWMFMRGTDMFLAIPGLLVMIMLASLFGASLYMTIIVIAAVFWPSTARIIRAEVLSVREKSYVEACRAIGASDIHLIIRHILPNISAPVFVQLSLQLAAAIITESGLSFLGLGAQPPIPSWGNIVADGRFWLLQNPWMPLFAGLAIWITSLSFNLMGDGFRDVLDPYKYT